MESLFRIYFHGADADEVVSIIESGVLRPKNNQLFFSRYSWESCLKYGADRRRGASFVIKVRISAPTEATTVFCETPGTRDTAVIRTDRPIPAEVLELYVRRMRKDEPAQLERVSGIEAIKNYLTALL